MFTSVSPRRSALAVTCLMFSPCRSAVPTARRKRTSKSNSLSVILCLAILLTSALCASRAKAAIYDILPTTDTVYHSWNYGGPNWGVNPSLAPNPDNFAYYSGYGEPYFNYYHTTLTYSLDSVPVDETIASVSLNLCLLGGNGLCTMNGVDFDASQPGWISFDVSGSVAPGGTASFTITPWAYLWEASRNGSYVSFGSAESGQAPYLQVTTVPEPSTAVVILIGMGLLGAAGFRRKFGRQRAQIVPPIGRSTSGLSINTR